MNNIREWLFSPASTNLRVLAWVFVMLVVILLITRAVKATAHAMTGKTTAFMDWVKDAPTTNLRIFVGILLAVVFVIGSMLAMVLGYTITDTAMMYIGGFILLQMGLDVAQYGWKRSTFKPEALGMTKETAPPTPAGEIVAATGQAPLPAAPTPPTATQALEAAAKLPQITATDLPAGSQVTGEGD